MKTIERIVEWLLWESRLIIIFAVISSVLAAFVLVGIGTYDILVVLKHIPHAFISAESFEKYHGEAITHIISAIDAYLISTVLLIFGLGLYELFISRIDYIEQETKSSRILEVHTLDQLKEKLAKVIIMVLIVTFFKHAVDLSYGDVKNLLFLSIGIALIAVSVYFMGKGHSIEENEKNLH
ncbi:MAG: YqhA family protein [Aquificae bacterium]|nr:YqhA family protein [Aquificota bacterium]